MDGWPNLVEIKQLDFKFLFLTGTLQSSLGGDGKACLVVNVSPLASNLNETVITFNFGSAAKQVELGKATQSLHRTLLQIKLYCKLNKPKQTACHSITYSSTINL